MERPLRFCMITTFYPPYNFGGDGIFVQRLSNELARRGHFVDVIHCIDAYQLKGHRTPEKSANDHQNVTIHGLRSRFGFMSPLATHQTGFPLFKSARIQKILNQGFDVIHYHNISLVGGPGILTYGQGIKLYTMHEYWLVCPTHALFKYNRAACHRPQCLTCAVSYRRPPQWWRYLGLMKTAVRHVDAFISPSLFSKNIHQQMGITAPIVHIPNFVPSAPPPTESPRSYDGKPYFLFVGRLEKLKGLHTLIPLFRRYQRAELWVAGTGSYEMQLRQMAEGTSNIRFLGHKNETELRVLYDGAMAIIIPSITYEMAPLVTLEAFRQQTPVIVRNLGGMPEPVQETGGGFIYNTDEELLAAMDQLCRDGSLRKQLGLLGYQGLRRNWTADVHLKHYFELIGQIALARGQPLDQRTCQLSPISVTRDDDNANPALPW
jgi:glycosyltransferase involved in cell wall biosynthesis